MLWLGTGEGGELTGAGVLEALTLGVNDPEGWGPRSPPLGADALGVTV